MAVEVKYVVIREGEEKMSFASKKEADAYDKMLDLAEVLEGVLVNAPVAFDDAQREQMALWLAETLSAVFRSGKLPDPDAAPMKSDTVTDMPTAKRSKVA